MGELRIFLRARYLLAVGLVALALAMKVLVPVGFMLNHAVNGPLLTLCPNANPGMNLDPRPASPPDPHAHHAGHHMDAASSHAHHDGHAGNEHGGDEHGNHGATSTCPYSLMPMASLSGADGVQLAALLVFILALGFVPVACPRLSPIPYLRPPLRGPPEARV